MCDPGCCYQGQLCYSPGNLPFACGLDGTVCQTCQSDQVCTNFACVAVTEVMPMCRAHRV